MMLLKVENLSITFATDEGPVTPVRNVSFTLEKGQTLGLVGESGSGKSISTKALMGLLPSTARLGDQSQIYYCNKQGETLAIEHLKPSNKQLQRLRGGEMGMIFQEPMASFSPVYSIGNQMIEAIRQHKGLSKKAARGLAIETLTKVGISNPQYRVDQYPHELSGGMRQRAMIALALATEPALLIADEPTTALDVTLQAQVLALMHTLQKTEGMAMIFISHDLAVISQIADHIAVMYLGEVIEYGPTAEVIGKPQHPYTRGLLNALPDIARPEQRLKAVPGDIPSPLERPSGCAFHSRCPKVQWGLCDKTAPKKIFLSEHHHSHCHLLEPQP